VPKQSKEEQKMKKLIVISFLTLIVMFPSVVFAGSVTATPVTANFDVSLSTSISPSGTANITYADGKWTVTLNMKGLLKNHSDYVFQFSLYDQLIKYYDFNLAKTDSKGNLVQTFTVSGVDAKLPDPVGYNIVRIIDKCGKSGGQHISSVDQSTVDPNLTYRKRGTIVIRAREDGIGGSLIFN
jgi:hypothetical protein